MPRRDAGAASLFKAVEYRKMQDDDIVERLMSHAMSQPDKPALRFLEGDVVSCELSYAQLDRRIRATAAYLRSLAEPGERALLLLPTSANYVVAFYACLYAGMIAVPAYPPENGGQRYTERLNGILCDATPRLILIDGDSRPTVTHLLAGAADVHLLHMDEIDLSGSADWLPPRISSDAIAFLQYTSGSTSRPKGVCVSHGNLVANLTAIGNAMAATADDALVSWLPLYHDMGLIGCLLFPLFAGCTDTLMSPRNFLQRPRRWLEAIHRFGGTISGGPDFAFALCSDRIPDDTVSELDLSRWRVAFSGSEFVRRQTVDKFVARFAPAGFDPRAWMPSYGLAEATLYVSGNPSPNCIKSHTLDTAALAEKRIVDAEQGTVLVSCGRVAAGHEVRIMRVDGSAIAEHNTIGEVWFSGPSVTQGYWNNAAATQAAFVVHDSRRWLRTGDVGFIRDGAVVITGRLKDILVIRGQNLYPTDIEQAVEQSVTSVRAGRVAAFPVELDGQEGIGVAAEISRGVIARTTPEAIAAAISDAVLCQCDERPAVIVLLNAQGMPLTTSGKLQRSVCHDNWSALDSFAVLENGRRRADNRGAALDVVPATDMERALAAIWGEVLGRQAIGRHDDFFVLGGNSIAAAQVAAAVRDQYGVEPALRSFFDAPTLEAFAAHVTSVMQAGKQRTLPAITPAPRDGLLPLSYAQERLWFLWNLDPASTAYTVASAIPLRGPLNRTALSSAFAEVARRHEALRTTFSADDGVGRQIIHDAMAIALRQEDLSRHPAAERDAIAAAYMRDVLAQPFDLKTGPLVRASLLRFSDDEHELLLSAHHIVVDGRSLDILLNELAELYRGFTKGGIIKPPPAVQYADYAVWQRAWLAAGEGDKQLAYWRTRLGDEHPVLGLPADRPRPEAQSHRGETIALNISAALAARLRKVANSHRISPFMLLLAAYQALLYRFTGQDDLRIGVPVANRRHPQLESLIGFFVNTLVLRANINGDLVFSDLLARTKDDVIAALDHQDLPFEQLVDALRVSRSAGHNPLFQAKFNFMTEPRGLPGVEGLRSETRIIDLVGAHFDLALDIIEGPSGMEATLNYASDLFEADTIRRIGSQFVAVLEQIAENTQCCLSDLAIAEDAQQIVPSHAVSFPFNDVIMLHRAAFAGRPSAVALRGGDDVVTAAELERRSNALACALTARGVTRDVPVALWMDRSTTFVTALLGVMKAGGAYVPLDPKWPVERVRRLLAESGIALLLVDGESRETARTLDCMILDCGDAALLDGSDVAPDIVIHPEQAAYVIYTSGSTGKPKGVTVSHRALANYVQALLTRLRPAPDATMAMVSTVAADLGHTVLFGALAAGATLQLFSPRDSFDADRFARTMRDSGVDILKIAPSHLRGLLQASPSVDVPPRQTLVLGGEACDAALVAMVRELRPACRILNHYGPTETTVGVLTHELDANESGGPIPMGLPLANVRAHVLDDALNVVPIGVAGELYIGGPGVARGYRAAAGLTAERFVPDPFGPPGERLYRTGDRVRCDRDSRLIFLGRGDDQIKLRGYRIELDEVARLLKAIDGVDEAVAVVRPVDTDERQQLIGYCVPRPGAALDPVALRKRLSALLPDYMVPARIVVLEALPLTLNGKVDRKALPAPDHDAPGRSHEAPQGEIEEAIASVWREVLKTEPVGRNDNFFELGGDSILSLQVIARLRKRGTRLTPKQVFEKQTIASLAAVASSAPATSKQKTSSSTQHPATGPHDLLPIQLRFFAEDIAERSHWNQAALLRPRAGVDWSVLRQALTAVVARHDALRLRFTMQDGGWRAEHGATPAAEDLLWLHEDVTPSSVTTLSETAQASLDLSAGPLLRAVGMDLSDGSQRLLLVIHHLVVDGVSWRVLLEDLAQAYAQLSAGEAVRLPPKSESYASWGARLRAQAGLFADELDYWLERGATGDLRCDRLHDDIDRVAVAEEVSLVLDRDVTDRLLRAAPSAYRTQVNDLLLAALSRALARWSGMTTSVIELEGHGREDVFAGLDIARAVGWFTSAFPLQLSHGDASTAKLIKATKEELRSIPHRGLGYGVLRHLGTAEQREALSRLREPQLVFNYLGQFDTSLGVEAPFTLASESAGAARSSSAPLGRWLSINGQVANGCLRFSLTYGRKRYDRATIEDLASCYSEALREVTEHCTSGVSGVTPSDFVLARLSQGELDELHLDWRAVEDIYPLSPMQQGMLFHALKDGTSGIYVNQVGVEIGGLDAARLRAAWQAVSDRHAVLRTGFVWRELSGLAQQVVYRHVEVPFIDEDWRSRSLAPDALEAALAKARDQERARGFDLSHPPLQRVRLIRLTAGRHYLIWTHHHVLLDGWSSARLIAEVLRQEGGESLPPVAGRYRDYIGYLQGRDRAASEQFWRDVLSAPTEPSLLADAFGGTERRDEQSGHSSHTLSLDTVLSERLSAFARRERVTLNTLVQGAWAQLLHQHTGQRVVSFGATVAGRPADLTGAEEMLGLFINTLPVVDEASPQQRVGHWLRALQESNLALREHEWMPLYEIQRLAGRPGRALFDTILVFENYPIDQALHESGREGPRFGQVHHVSNTNYALTVAVFVVPQKIDLSFTYDRSRFDDETVRRLGARLQALLERMAADSEAFVGALSQLDATEMQQMLAWSGTPSTAHGDERDVVTQIERQAAARPDAVALVCADETVCYRVLNARANRLACWLRRQGVGPDVMVGLAVERSPAMVVALLAILKAGGAYVPLDPDYPATRLTHMLRDSGARLLLTQEGLLAQLGPMLAAARDSDRMIAAWPLAAAELAAANEDDSNLGLTLHPHNLAYVIYTSGSTGMPKGVAVAHGPLAMHCDAIGRLYAMQPGDRELQFASISFDIAHERWLVPLMTGGALVLRPGRDWTIDDLITEIEARAVSVLFVPPAYANQLSDILHRRGQRLSLRACIVGGEAWSDQGVRTLRRVTDIKLLVNAYGPTETVIAPMAWPVDDSALSAGRTAPIGRPVGTRSAYILDADLNLVPAGVVGELYIGGIGLARSYYNRAGLTAERFVPDPFGSGPGGRVYRTGDLARWRADGAVEYVGRADEQVKIRGFRIEPGEIEARLMECKGVRAAVVVVREAASGKQLIGYVTGEGPLDGAALRTSLATMLPDYMVPGRIVVLDALPLTPNGKIDRRALPDPEVEPASQHVPPRTETEAALAAIWCEVLGQQTVSVTDNFFELGGDSIIAIRLAARIRSDLDCPISLRDVFENGSIEDLARQIEERSRASQASGVSKIDALLTSLETAAE
ncbi:MAG: amino acid adenylation domain-containing protein [Rhizobiales bacterium]|nr:amino acid adenylation domain-containing protein [Hyphomicrobiales bacterium]